MFLISYAQFYISASVKINLEKNISLSRVPVFWYALNQTHGWLSLRVLLEEIPLLRIEPRRVADLEIKSIYTVSKVVHVPLWYSETLVMTALIIWMQSGSTLSKIWLLNLHWLQPLWYAVILIKAFECKAVHIPPLRIKSRNMAD